MTIARKAMGPSVFSKIAVTATSSGRTPRKSLIVVLPDDDERRWISMAEAIRARLAEDGDIVVASAGRPPNFHLLRTVLSRAQFVFAPRGTSAEDLRAQAMEHASGDVVFLLAEPEGTSRMVVTEGRTSC